MVDICDPPEIRYFDAAEPQGSGWQIGLEEWGEFNNTFGLTNGVNDNDGDNDNELTQKVIQLKILNAELHDPAKDPYCCVNIEDENRTISVLRTCKVNGEGNKPTFNSTIKMRVDTQIHKIVLSIRDEDNSYFGETNLISFNNMAEHMFENQLEVELYNRNEEIGKMAISFKKMGRFDLLDGVRDKDDVTDYTEEAITVVLNDVNIAQHATVANMPSYIVNSVLQKLTKGKASHLSTGQEQEALKFFKDILVCDKIEVLIIAKALRYLLRKDKSKKSAFVIVDVQNDFISGALALRHTPGKQEGEEVVPVINHILEKNEFAGVFYTIDWHPENHCSYVTNVSQYALHESSQIKAEDAKLFDKVVYAEPKILEQVMWPEHCLQGSEGAELHSELKVVDNGIKIYKGQIPYVDSYSGVWDNGKLSRSELLGHLFDLDITDVYVCGLATDFCVGFTALDIAEQCFNTFVVMDACRGVADESISDMTLQMKNVGCKLISAADIH